MLSQASARESYKTEHVFELSSTALDSSLDVQGLVQAWLVHEPELLILESVNAENALALLERVTDVDYEHKPPHRLTLCPESSGKLMVRPHNHKWRFGERLMRDLNRAYSNQI